MLSSHDSNGIKTNGSTLMMVVKCIIDYSGKSSNPCKDADKRKGEGPELIGIFDFVAILLQVRPCCAVGEGLVSNLCIAGRLLHIECGKLFCGKKWGKVE